MHLKQVRRALAFTLMALLAASAVTAKVYVADAGANTVSVIDSASSKRLASIPVGRGPHNVQVSPDGKWVWVTNNGEPGAVAEKMSAEQMSKSEHGAMAGAGAKVGAVWVIDTATDTVVAKVPVGRHPAHVVVASDGRTAYITNRGDNTAPFLEMVLPAFKRLTFWGFCLGLVESFLYGADAGLVFVPIHNFLSHRWSGQGMHT